MLRQLIRFTPSIRRQLGCGWKHYRAEGRKEGGGEMRGALLSGIDRLRSYNGRKKIQPPVSDNQQGCYCTHNIDLRLFE